MSLLIGSIKLNQIEDPYGIFPFKDPNQTPFLSVVCSFRRVRRNELK